MQNLLHGRKTTCLIMWFAALSVANLHSQPSPQLVQITIPLKFSCTAPTATINSGAKYTNTCTISQGLPPYGISVSTLPAGLTATKTPTSTSITVSGVPPAGNYQYYIYFSGGGYTTTFILVGLDVVAATASAIGNTTIRCIQKGGVLIKDPSLCQVCVITAASGRICNLDDDFNPTGRTPLMPTSARVTSLYMNSAPITSDVQAYTLAVSHMDSTNISQQIAYENQGKSPAYATQAVPVRGFNGQLVANGSPWSFNFSPLMSDSSLYAEWTLDFLYNINWQVGSPTTKSSVKTTEAAVAPETPGLSTTQEKFQLSFSAPSKLDGASATSWNAMALADLTGDGSPDLLLQDPKSGAVAVWALSESRIAETIDLPSSPGPGWTLAAAADLTGDGMPDLIFQNDASGVIDVWQMVGTDVAARLELADIPPVGWKVTGAGVLTEDGATSLILQEPTGAIHVWKMSGLEVAARSEIVNAPASGGTVRAVTDLTGDGVPDLLVENAGRLAVWQMLDGQILQARDIDSSASAGTKVVGLLSGATFLVQSESDGSVGVSQLGGALFGKRLAPEPQ
jgi:hypothetical protein